MVGEFMLPCSMSGGEFIFVLQQFLIRYGAVCSFENARDAISRLQPPRLMDTSVLSAVHHIKLTKSFDFSETKECLRVVRNKSEMSKLQIALLHDVGVGRLVDGNGKK